MGSNHERCYWCHEYYELTSDFGREIADAASQSEQSDHSIQTDEN
jgi:hypothetical protein